MTHDCVILVFNSNGLGAGTFVPRERSSALSPDAEGALPLALRRLRVTHEGWSGWLVVLYLSLPNLLTCDPEIHYF